MSTNQFQFVINNSNVYFYSENQRPDYNTEINTSNVHIVSRQYDTTDTTNSSNYNSNINSENYGQNTSDFSNHNLNINSENYGQNTSNYNSERRSDNPYSMFSNNMDNSLFERNSGRYFLNYSNGENFRYFNNRSEHTSDNIFNNNLRSTYVMTDSSGDSEANSNYIPFSNIDISGSLFEFRNNRNSRNNMNNIDSSGINNIDNFGINNIDNSEIDSNDSSGINNIDIFGINNIDNSEINSNDSSGINTSVQSSLNRYNFVNPNSRLNRRSNLDINGTNSNNFRNNAIQSNRINNVRSNLFRNSVFGNFAWTESLPNQTRYIPIFTYGSEINNFDVSGTISEIINEVERYFNRSDSGNIPRGLSMTSLYNNSTVSLVDNSLTNNEDIVCVICLREFQTNDIVRKLNNCAHYFHSNCIERWFGNQTCCPTCRDNIQNV